MNINSDAVKTEIHKLFLEKSTQTFKTNKCHTKCDVKDVQMKDLKQSYRKHIKPKKQHEISQLGTVSYIYVIFRIV